MQMREKEEGTIVAVCFLWLLLFAVVEIIRAHFKILFILENLT